MSGRKVGLVLGSGAVRGYAVFPIIKALEKEKLEIAAASGSSVGAVIAAYYALHGEIDSLFNRVKKMTRKDFLKLVDPNKPKKSLIKGKKIREFLKENFFSERTFEDTRFPLFICATDIKDKKSVYLSQGNILDAVMASISIPGLVPPYIIKDRIYFDGGVLDPVPTQPLFALGLPKIIAINLMAWKRGQDKTPIDLWPALLTAFYMMTEKLASRQEDNRLYLIDLAFEPDPTSMLAFYRWKKNYEIGARYIDKKISEIRLWLET